MAPEHYMLAVLASARQAVGCIATFKPSGAFELIDDRE
jgi:hypothetical protein